MATKTTTTTTDTTDLCSVEDCGRLWVAKGLCMRHYQQQRRYGRITDLDNVEQCTMRGCERLRVARGYCWKHYARYVRDGDPYTLTVQAACNPDRRGEALDHIIIERLNEVRSLLTEVQIEALHQPQEPFSATTRQQLIEASEQCRRIAGDLLRLTEF